MNEQILLVVALFTFAELVADAAENVLRNRRSRRHFEETKS
jgi:hypothetical protein